MFGLILKELRKEKGLRQKDIALKLNTTAEAVSAWELGKTQPSIEVLIKLSEILNVSLDYLCGKTADITFEDEYQSNTLTPDEQRLLGYFRELPPLERGELLGTAKTLCAEVNRQNKRAYKA